MPKLDLFIENEGKSYRPVVKDDIIWETELRGAPGKLTFTVLNDGILNFQEGNQVGLFVDDAELFLGIVFTKSRNKDGTISVTAYDQLRYLKNKSVLKYEDTTAAGVVKMIAGDFGLTCGEIEDTKYVVPGRLEDNQTLFDMIKNALDETLEATKETYVLYDDCGKLALKNIRSMKTNLIVNEKTAEDFSYQTSIDSSTYNSIWLIYEDQEKGQRLIYPKEDEASIKRWGVLQYCETLKDLANAPKKAEALLDYYNRKTRSLSITKAFGDTRIRGGSSVPVFLDLGDMKANTYMVVEKVKHTLSASSHFMDLTLIGGDFSA